MDSFRFTRQSLEMKKSIDELFGAFVCREELTELIDDFEDEPADAKKDVERKISALLCAADKITGYRNICSQVKDKIDYGNLCLCEDVTNKGLVNIAASTYRKLAQKLPPRYQVDEQTDMIFEKKLAEISTTIYNTCKTSGDYITRLVKERCADLGCGFVNPKDSSRLIIFKKFLSAVEFPGTGYISRELRDYVCTITGISSKCDKTAAEKAIASLTDDNGQSETNVFKKLDEISNIITKAREEYDSVLEIRENVNIQYKGAKKDLANMEKELASAKKQLDKALIKAKKEFEKAEKAHKKAETKLENENKQLKKADSDNYNTIFDRVEAAKTALETTAAIKSHLENEYTSVKNQVQAVEYELNSEESEYGKLKAKYLALSAELAGIDATKEEKKSRYRDIQKKFADKWEPLFWADDIAGGYFNNQQITRKKLYWFAIIFEMTYCVNTWVDVYDAKTDIQKNLFYDYYADNLLNNILQDDTSKLKLYEKEPSGHGINFKNYAEVIYLYYLNRKDLTPLQKLLGAEKMIDDCSETSQTVLDYQIGKHGHKDTVVYEPMAERIMGLDEKSFCEFIKENYICGSRDYVPVHAASGSMSAAEVYKSLFEKLKKALAAYDVVTGLEKDKSAENELFKALCKNISDITGTQNYGNKDDLLGRLFERINEKFYVVEKKRTSVECFEATFLPKENVADYVTRTKLIILYYYLFMINHVNESLYYTDFRVFYENFCDENIFGEGVNDYLSSAGYQEINLKNIFDITVIFFAFKKLRDIRQAE